MGQPGHEYDQLSANLIKSHESHKIGAAGFYLY